MPGKINVEYPPFAKDRGVGYWLKPGNLWASRRKLRSDASNLWRYAFEPSVSPFSDRSAAYSALLAPNRDVDRGFKFIILGDTGEGDRSQYGLLPLIHAFDPDFIVINGDVAYPAGREEDYIQGFFEPYRDLNIPIWAVPGNHEYYSSHQGREFYEVFCSYKWAERWAEYGLRFVCQPGTYWELRHPGTRLVTIGLDTGKKGDLDGHGSGNPVDQKQLSWLKSRLELARAEDKVVVILFHIPALAHGELDKGVHLHQLHYLIAKYACVRLVIGAHHHNFQHYEPAIFRQFLNKVAPATAGLTHAAPHYIISGAGGAYLTSTDFNGAFQSEVLPTAEEWKKYAKARMRIVNTLGLEKTWLGALLLRGAQDALYDADSARMQSFLLVKVGPEGNEVSAVYLDDLEKLFPAGSTVNVMDPDPPFLPGAIDKCIRHTINF